MFAQTVGPLTWAELGRSSGTGSVFTLLPFPDDPIPAEADEKRYGGGGPVGG